MATNPFITFQPQSQPNPFYTMPSQPQLQVQAQMAQMAHQQIPQLQIGQPVTGYLQAYQTSPQQAYSQSNLSPRQNGQLHLIHVQQLQVHQPQQLKLSDSQIVPQEPAPAQQWGDGRDEETRRDACFILLKASVFRTINLKTGHEYIPPPHRKHQYGPQVQIDLIIDYECAARALGEFQDQSFNTCLDYISNLANTLTGDHNLCKIPLALYTAKKNKKTRDDVKAYLTSDQTKRFFKATLFALIEKLPSKLVAHLSRVFLSQHGLEWKQEPNWFSKNKDFTRSADYGESRH